MARLTALAPVLSRYDRTGAVEPCAEVWGADGISFDCPQCLGTQQSHRVTCWFANRNVPTGLRSPSPFRYHPDGATLDALTFIGPDDPTIDLSDGCGWRGTIAQGEVA